MGTTTTTVFLGPRKSNLATEGNLKPVMVSYIFLDDGIASQTRIAGAMDSKGGDRLFTTYFAASLAVSRSEGRQSSRSPEMLENDKRFMSLLFDLHKLSIKFPKRDFSSFYFLFFFLLLLFSSLFRSRIEKKILSKDKTTTDEESMLVFIIKTTKKSSYPTFAFFIP